MKVDVYTIKGKSKSKVDLPRVFSTDIRPDLVKKAVLAQQSHRLQPYGPDKKAGHRTSAFSWGPGHAVSRVPRVKGSRSPASGKGAIVPQAVGGRKGHPPEVDKVIYEKINKKEKRLATSSAIAATGIKDMVEKRGHKIENVPQIPMIVEDALEEIKTTKEMREIFSQLGIWDDIDRASIRKIRPGRGTTRGRKYKIKKSALLVINDDRGIVKGARNYLGIDIVTVGNLNIEDLAPGTHMGRLTIFTETALSKLDGRF